MLFTNWKEKVIVALGSAHAIQEISANKLSLNVEKTNFVLFHRSRQIVPDTHPFITIDGRPVSRVNFTKFLGTYLDENMNWKEHIRVKSNQIAKVNGVLCRLKYQLPPHILKLIYNCLILPHISYSITSWGNTNNKEIKRMKILQKKSIRIISNSSYNNHAGPLFKKTKLLKQDDIFRINCCKIYHKLKKGLLPTYFKTQLEANSDFHQYGTRQQNLIHTHNINCDLLKQSINFKISESWNSLSTEVQEKNHSSIHSFSNHLKNYILSGYPDKCIKKNCTNYYCRS